MPVATNANGVALFPSDDWWLTELEKRKSGQEPTQGTGFDDEVLYDEEDLAQSAADAWWHAGASDSDSSDNDSVGSLPAGPPLQKRPAGPGGHVPTCLNELLI